MKLATKDYIISTVFRTNILPIMSKCNTRCVFCSHKQNPEGIEVYTMPQMSMEDFKDIINYLSPDRKIVIGESATRIIEGEPFLHKDFVEVLKYVRSKYSATPIQITTNGILLNSDLIDKLTELGNIELNISVNGVSPEQRKKMLGLDYDDKISEKLNMLKGRVKFSSSFVLVPDILNNQDVEDIIKTLEYCGAEAIRLFLPGYTRLAKKDIDFYELFQSTDLLIASIREKYTIPVIIEPSIIDDLDCRVEGVIKGAPAWEAGIKAGDIIYKVDGLNIKSRVDGFNVAYRKHNPIVTVSRDGELLEMRLKKLKNSSPGFIVLYDIDTDVLDSINKAVLRYRVNNILFMTSELAENIIGKLLAHGNLRFDYRVISVKNAFFGGTIKCAGLLTSNDIISAAREFLTKNERPDLILLPPIMFDYSRNDLLGVNIKDIENQIKIPVDTL